MRYTLDHRVAKEAAHALDDVKSLEALRGGPVAEVVDQDEDEIVCILNPGAKVWIGDNLYAAPQQADKPGE